MTYLTFYFPCGLMPDIKMEFDKIFEQNYTQDVAAICGENNIIKSTEPITVSVFRLVQESTYVDDIESGRNVCIEVVLDYNYIIIGLTT